MLNNKDFLNLERRLWREGYVDNDIFYYTDGEPINVGDILSDSFVVTAFEV